MAFLDSIRGFVLSRDFFGLTLCGIDRQRGAASSRAKVRAWHRVSFLLAKRKTIERVGNISLTDLVSQEHRNHRTLRLVTGGESEENTE